MPRLLRATLVAFFLLPAVTASAAPVVISEFRTRGPDGGNDEFVELRNSSAAPVDISGYELQGCATASGNGSNRAFVPEGITLEAGQAYLFTNTATSGYSGSTPGDRTYITGIADFAATNNQAGIRILDAGGAVQDQVGSPNSPCREGTGFTTPGTATDNSFERIGGTQDTGNNVADFQGPKPGDPQNFTGATGEEPPSVTKIHDIQGAGASSPRTGQTVTIEGIVTGVDDEIGANFERTFPGDAGIFVQEEQADQDDDPSTSEGVFVGFVRPRSNYPPGTVVRLEGQVVEQFQETRVNLTRDSTPTVLGTAPVPSPVVIDPVAARDQATPARPYYESLEGMNVLVDVATATSGGRNRFGETFLTLGVNQAPEDRVFRTEPTPELIAADSDAGAGDPDNPLEDTDSTTELRMDLFDVVRGLEGPLNFSFGHYKVINQERRAPAIEPGPTQYPYDELAPRRDDQLRVASFNVENFFPAGSSGDIGHIRTQEEYEEQRDRIADAIGVQLERPDIVAVQEVADIVVLQDLADTLGGYTAYLVEGNDSRSIDVGFLIADGVEHSNVRQLGKTAAGPAGFSCSDVAGGLFDRPPLAVDVTHRGVSFTVFSNHFSSKSAPDDCRAAQAAFVRDQVAGIEAAGGEAIVTGDLNAFETESALTTLEDGTTSLDNLWDEAPESERYSYHFDGRLQTLDHMLVTDGLFPRVEDFRYAHFDNDYYERRDAPQPDGHALSDHDPPIVTLDLAGEPVNAGAPEIVRRNERKPVTRNETLTADRGEWEVDEGELSFDLQWLRCDSAGCTEIDGATGETYKVAKADKGHSIVLRVTATGDGGSTTAQSAPVGPVQGPSAD